MKQEIRMYCYVNFEDERFLDFKAQEFEQLNEVLIELYGKVEVYFFDEVQNIAKFEAFVRRLQDQGKKVVLTGSNASLLSSEMGTKLTGRYKSYEVYPFSLKEFLRFIKEMPEKESMYDTEKKVNVLKRVEEYYQRGGFPEYLKNNDKEYLKTVYENIVYRDIIARYAIRKQKIMKELINILATNVSSLFTYNTLRTSLGLSNAITVKEYIEYLQNAYLFFELLKFEVSVRKQLAAPKKIYLIDPALHQIAGITLSPNKGRVLENIVFIELRRRNKEVYYHADKNECDFVIKEGVKIVEAIQVCYELNAENREREIAGLFDALERFHLPTGTIVTHEQNEEIRYKGRKIRIVPAVTWLLGWSPEF